MNLELILSKNHDLLERFEKERWRIFYDRRADMFVLHGEVSPSSTYLPVNDDGFMVRADEDTGKICALAIENFGRFTRKHGDFRLMYYCVRYPLLSRLTLVPIMYLLKAKDAVSELGQRREFAEYVSREAYFRAA